MINSAVTGPGPESDAKDWREVVKQLQVPNNARALWQLINTVVPYIAIWVAMYFTREISTWLTLALAVLAGLFLVRAFILFHDCGHNSFFSSRRATTWAGICLGALAFVSFHHWRWEHWRHHASAGDLDRRGIGDVWTMTVNEYMNAPWATRVRYRLVRNPLLMFTFGPTFMFLIWQRFPSKKSPPSARRSVYAVNAYLLLMAVAMSLVYGVWSFLLLQFVVIAVAGTIGVWMFYVQHQFEDVYWRHSDEWTAEDAALQGSSYFALPAVLRWFTGNIGYHHVHHLGPRIPNYYLKRCHEAVPRFRQVPTLTLWTSLRCCALRLWDEELQQLVGYRQAFRLHLARTQSDS